mgnify:CR=1 FL=1
MHFLSEKYVIIGKIRKYFSSKKYWLKLIIISEILKKNNLSQYQV